MVTKVSTQTWQKRCLWFRWLCWIGLTLLLCLAPPAYPPALAQDPAANGGQAGTANAGHALRFYGNGVNDIDRVKIRLDDPANNNPGPPADIGAQDFTLEFWLKGLAAENLAASVACGANNNWIYGNIVIDRDRYNQDRAFGLSLAGGRLVFGVSGNGTGERTICGTTNVVDNQWHHVVIQRRRSDGWMWLYVDGVEQAQINGPDGDISYPDDGIPGNFCGGPCTNSDPFLVIAAEKHDAGAQFPSFSGWVDELRLSNTLRYTANFTRPVAPFAPDANTVALYHFDEGSGDVINDLSGAAGGPSNGVRRFGGNPAGPVWVVSDAPLSGTPPTPGATSTPTPTPTHTPTPQPGVMTVVDFDNPAPAGNSGDLLNGLLGGIDFGTGQWRWEGAYSANPTNHIYFAANTGTVRTFTFAGGARALESLRAFVTASGTLMLSDDRGQSITQPLTPGVLQLLTTGWTQPSTTVTVNFSAGWALGLDDITYRTAGQTTATPTYTPTPVPLTSTPTATNPPPATATATPVAPTATPTTSANGTIGGNVTNDSGSPLAGIRVGAYRRNGSRWQLAARADSNASGDYLIANLLPNNYRIRFYAPSGAYSTEWYNNVASANQGTDVTVDSGNVTSGINAALAQAVARTAQASGSVAQSVDPQTGQLTLIAWPGSQMHITRAVSCGDTGATVEQVSLAAGDLTFAMTETSQGRGFYQVELRVPEHLPVNHRLVTAVRWQCVAASPQSAQIAETTIGAIVTSDTPPSGQITDAATGQAIANATVTLYRVPDWRPRTSPEDTAPATCESSQSKPPGAAWSQLAPVELGEAVSPDITDEVNIAQSNPQSTGSDGRYLWQTPSGCWYVEVEAEGYAPARSPLVGAAPTLVELNVALVARSDIYLPLVIR